jgi:hypothetical protein
VAGAQPSQDGACGVEGSEVAVPASDEVVEARRPSGVPDHSLHMGVADAEALEAFQVSELVGLPAVAPAVSHRTTRLFTG